MNKNLRLILSLTAISFMVWSCSGNKDEGAQKVENDEPETKDTVDEGPKPFYQIPTPNELFTVIKEIGGKAKNDLMNSPANVDKYTDNYAKGINFGVYSADLAYASAYEMGPTSLDYFKVIEKMGDDLGISGAFDKTIFERVEKNLTNGDSLLSISNDTYFEAYSYLEENEKGAVLGLIVTGGWIESMYIVTNLVDKYSDNNPIIERIAGQKYTLENLLGFLYNYADDENIGMAVAELEKIQAVYGTMEESGDIHETSVAKEGDVNVISGGKTLKMTKETFEELKAVVKEIRTAFVGVKS
jgi:hypothetical protein